MTVPRFLRFRQTAAHARRTLRPTLFKATLIATGACNIVGPSDLVSEATVLPLTPGFTAHFQMLRSEETAQLSVLETGENVIEITFFEHQANQSAPKNTRIRARLHDIGLPEGFFIAEGWFFRTDINSTLSEDGRGFMLLACLQDQLSVFSLLLGPEAEGFATDVSPFDTETGMLRPTTPEALADTFTTAITNIRYTPARTEIREGRVLCSDLFVTTP